MDTIKDHGSSEKVDQVPDDIWIIVFKYFADFPVLFNLYNVNSQLTRVLDNYFHKHLTIDFNKYSKLNKKINIVQQADAIVNYYNRTVNGIIVDTIDFNHSDLFETAVQTLLSGNSLELKLFHYKYGNEMNYGDVVSSSLYVINLMLSDVVINLVDLRINNGLSRLGVGNEVNLSQLVNLRSLDLTSITGGCIVFPSVSLTNLALDFCREVSDVALRGLLVASEDTLVTLTLSDNRFVCNQLLKYTNSDVAMTSLVFPNLKSITIGHDAEYPAGAGDKKKCALLLDLSRSLRLESISLFSMSRVVQVVGYDFRTHIFIKRVRSDFNSVNFASFAEAPLENLQSFEFCNGKDKKEWTLKRITNGCDQLEYLAHCCLMPGSRAFSSEFRKIIRNNSMLSRFDCEFLTPRKLEFIIKSIIDTKNESLELIKFHCDCLPIINEFDTDLLENLIQWGYKRSKLLCIETANRVVSEQLLLEFMSRFNIKFTFVLKESASRFGSI